MQEKKLQLWLKTVFCNSGYRSIKPHSYSSSLLKKTSVIIYHRFEITPLKKAFVIFVSLSLLTFVLEFFGRVLICFSEKTPFLHPSEIIYKYYPQLPPIQQANISNADSIFDVLILSCSVLHTDWGDIISQLRVNTKLSNPYSSLKIYNASGVGHSSYDNWVKYSLLKNKNFDLIVYYDAINDARLNNCPAEVFKTDYSHYEWYLNINSILKHPEINFTVLPYLLERCVVGLRKLVFAKSFIPVHYTLRPEWLDNGNSFKSLSCYKKNLTNILKLSIEKNSRLMFVGFLRYLPVDYSLNDFETRKLNYTFCNRSRETEIWGHPENVVSFIDSANLVANQLSLGFPNSTYVDLRTEMTESGEHFADICHFSKAGLNLFAKLLGKKIQQENLIRNVNK